MAQDNIPDEEAEIYNYLLESYLSKQTIDEEITILLDEKAIYKAWYLNRAVIAAINARTLNLETPSQLCLGDKMPVVLNTNTLNFKNIFIVDEPSRDILDTEPLVTAKVLLELNNRYISISFSRPCFIKTGSIVAVEFMGTVYILTKINGAWTEIFRYEEIDV